MECELNGTRLRVYKDGKIERWKTYSDSSKDKWKIAKQFIHTLGYKYINLRYDGKDKKYYVHRVVAFVYLVFDINDLKIEIDHIDRNRSHNNINNLRLSDHYANAQNTKCRGYFWDKQCQKWRAKIRVNHKTMNLGFFINEDDAHQAYLDAKKIHHTLND